MEEQGRQPPHKEMRTATEVVMKEGMLRFGVMQSIVGGGGVQRAES